jgi:hypothetical protein
LKVTEIYPSVTSAIVEPPPLRPSAMPVNTVCSARVTMNDEARCSETRKPATSPPARPTASAPTIATAAFAPWSDMSCTPTTAESPMSPGKERSNSPLESTTVRPAARIRIGAASSRIERMLSNVPNTAGSAIQKAATMMAKPTRVA